MYRSTAFVALPIAVALTSGCSLKRMAMTSVANSLARSGDTFASDNDPELIRDAVPFSLKLVETLLGELPDHRGLLLTACSGFTQYGYAFIDYEADLLKDEDYPRSAKMQARARRMYLRARDYCLRNVDLRYPGLSAKLRTAPAEVLRITKKEDVAVLYWTGAAWGKAVSLSLDQPALIGDLPIVEALVRRALELDEAFQDGAIHEVMISLEGLPEAMGGSPERARRHFERAIELSRGAAAGPYVTFARSVLVAQGRREEFVQRLEQALAIDVDQVPRFRLANTLAQEQARQLLERADHLFLSGGATDRLPVTWMAHQWH